MANDFDRAYPFRGFDRWKNDEPYDDGPTGPLYRHQAIRRCICGPRRCFCGPLDRHFPGDYFHRDERIITIRRWPYETEERQKQVAAARR